MYDVFDDGYLCQAGTETGAIGVTEIEATGIEVATMVHPLEGGTDGSQEMELRISVLCIL